MSTLWPFDDLFDISIPTSGSEFDILTTAFVSAIVPFLVITCGIQLFCWVCCSSHGKKGAKTKIGKQRDPRHTAEAQRWLRQAIHDRQAALNDHLADNPAYEWVCFKCQQAAEKALKAALIVTTTSIPKPATHDLRQFMVPLADDEQLDNLITDLQNCIGFVSSMRYPDKHPYPKVPRDAFTKEQAEQALCIMDALLEHVQDYYVDDKS